MKHPPLVSPNNGVQNISLSPWNFKDTDSHCQGVSTCGLMSIAVVDHQTQHLCKFTVKSLYHNSSQGSKQQVHGRWLSCLKHFALEHFVKRLRDWLTSCISFFLVDLLPTLTKLLYYLLTCRTDIHLWTYASVNWGWISKNAVTLTNLIFGGISHWNLHLEQH